MTVVFVTSDASTPRTTYRKFPLRSPVLLSHHQTLPFDTSWAKEHTAATGEAVIGEASTAAACAVRL